MKDGGQGHVVEVRARGLDAAGGQAEGGGARAEAAQAGAVEADVHELPDAGQAHGAPEVAADHGQAGRPAVRLVDLADVGEAAAAPALLEEVPGLVHEGTVAVRGRSLRGRRLRSARLLRRRRLRGQELLGEVEGDARGVAVVVLRDPLRDRPPEVRVRRGQALEAVVREPQQPHRGDRLHGGRPRLAAEQRDLAEEVALAQEEEVLAPAVHFAKDLEASFLDDVHRVRGPALLHHARAGGGVHRLQLGEDQAQRRRAQARERRVDAEEVRHVAVAALQREERPDLGVAAQQGLEDRPVHLEEGDVAGGADGGGAARPVHVYRFPFFISSIT